MLIGGPAVSSSGARSTMGASAIATIALAILVTMLIPERRGLPWRRRRPAHHDSPPASVDRLT
jgi:hypothetical protein